MPPKNYYSKQKRNYSLSDNNQNQKNRVQIAALLINNEKIGLDIPYKVISSDWPFKNMIKDGGGRWEKQQKLWVLSTADYANKMSQFLQFCKQKGYFFVTIPKFVYEAIQQMPLQIHVKISKYSEAVQIRYPEIQLFIEAESLPFYQKLYSFQKQSLRFGISKHGRLLIADEMGVGKTIQSLAIAYIYRNQWPLLIICPSTLRYNWQNEILNWYGSFIKKTEIQVYTKGGSNLRDNTKILIISYELAWKYKDLIVGFQIAIADQAHYLKNSGCKRTDILVPLLAEKRRILLLTGTPAFARPRQIYNLASIIRPDIYTNFKQFGNRYCDPQRNPWSGMIEYNGCKNSKELFFLLKNRVMLRRLKKQVLSQLPDKQRQKILIETNKNICKQISNLISQNSSSPMNSAESMIMEMFGAKSEHFDNKKERDTIMEAYRLTGSAKTEGVIQYILALLENDVKILVFAHHQIMLNAIQEALQKKKYQFVRIDGNVQIKERQEAVDRFQADSKIMVALLSIAAAGVGLTLTASNTVIFAELHWTPGMLIQAQDRAHRIGQKNSVNCHYLIGQNTLDPILYNYLLKKINNVSTFVDGEQSNLHIQELAKGQQGKISKRVKQQINQTSDRKKENKCIEAQRITPIRKQYKIEVGDDENFDSNYPRERANLNTEQLSQWTDISSQTKEDPDDGTASLCSRKKITNLSKIVQQEDDHNNSRQQRDKGDSLRSSQILRRISSGIFGSGNKHFSPDNNKLVEGKDETLYFNQTETMKPLEQSYEYQPDGNTNQIIKGSSQKNL